ncbi:hypothetical protein M413DRAFT_12829 [Hebeloma cylindrosporum]|uniref:Uncharacterized protein n=1 Tax=Hebeloma cylindrosporum TaxID=76867 RepID=A0A0C3BNX0_HEBCY|nr:hypothetical protein M413DRAFT_12829 [Hebeloma cylindrosporum h7]
MYMSGFDCGYYIKQDKFDGFIPRFQEEVDKEGVLHAWWFGLRTDAKSEIPFPSYHPPGSEGNKDGFIWFPLRRIESDAPDGPSEIEAGIEAKDIPFETILKDKDKPELVYFTKKYRTESKTLFVNLSKEPEKPDSENNSSELPGTCDDEKKSAESLRNEIPADFGWGIKQGKKWGDVHHDFQSRRMTCK